MKVVGKGMKTGTGARRGSHEEEQINKSCLDRQHHNSITTSHTQNDVYEERVVLRVSCEGRKHVLSLKKKIQKQERRETKNQVKQRRRRMRRRERKEHTLATALASE